MSDPTDLDLGRLLVFVTLHEGHLPSVPHRTAPTYYRLQTAGLVRLIESELELPRGCDVDNIPVLEAHITDAGKAIVASMLATAREHLGRIRRLNELDALELAAEQSP